MTSEAEVWRFILSQKREAQRRREPEVFEQWQAELTWQCATAENIIIPGLGVVPHQTLKKVLARVA